MKTVELLRGLQAVDSALDAAHVRLQQIASELADRSEFAAATRARRARADELRAIEAEQRDLELEMESLRQHLETTNQKLYGGRVGDAKELTNLTREAQQVRGQIAARDEQQFVLLERVEQAQTADVDAERHLVEVRNRRRTDEAALKAEREGLQESIATAEAEQANLRAHVDAAALRTYDNLRRTKSGLAVVDLRQRTCQACRVSLPIHFEQRARQGDVLVLCQSCGRILSPTG